MSRRGERALAGLLLLAGAAPFWAGRFLPFLDMPQHLGLASVLSRYADPEAGFSRYYAVGSAVDPYWGYYAVMWLLTRALPLELANRVLFSAWAVLLPLSVAFALRSLGRDGRWAVFALPLVWHANLFFGFAPFLVSLPLFFVAIGLAARDLEVERSSPSRALLLALAAAALFLSHAQTYLLLGLSALVLLASEWRGLGWALRRGAPYAPSVALFGAWLLPSFVWNPSPGAKLAHTVNYRTFGSIGNLGAVFESKAESLARAPERLWGMYADGSGAMTGAAWLFLLALSVGLAGWPEADRGSGRAESPGGAPGAEPRPGFRAALRAHRGELLAVLALASYVLLPVQVAGQWYLNARYLVFAALLAPAFVGSRATGWRLGLVGAVALLGLFSDANAALKVAAFQRQVGGFARLLERMEPGHRTLGLVFDRGAAGPVQQPLFLHFAAYYQALRGGDVGFSFAGLPAIPVRYRPGEQAPHPGEWAPQDFRWDEMGSFYDYFLVRGVPRGDAARLAEHADVLAEEAGFRLWRRRGAPSALSLPAR
jgi:hypothetical protein